MGTKLDKSIGTRLKHFRTNAGYTQAQLAELVGCETSTIGHCENGKSRISLTLLNTIAEKLNVEVDENADWGHCMAEKLRQILKQQNQSISY